jgi:predicted 2-oxoglutarate/Fe(II)-dependent dioxygenase YbiX
MKLTRRNLSSWSGCLNPLIASSLYQKRQDLFPQCFFIHNFLSGKECDDLIAKAEILVGYSAAKTDYPPSYRNNDRLIIDDKNLAKSFFDRIKGQLPQCQTFATKDGGGNESWTLHSINPRLRACRYTPGQYFNRHKDGVHFESPTLRSFMTFMVYLDEPPSFVGGDTVFQTVLCDTSCLCVAQSSCFPTTAGTGVLLAYKEVNI